MTNQDPQEILTVHKNGKRRQIPGWSFDDLARLKLIKANATPLSHHHHPHKNIIRLDDWRK